MRLERRADRRNGQSPTRSLRREIAAVAQERRLDAPAQFIHVRIARLNKALRVADGALDRGDLKAIGPMVRLVAALDRYHGLGSVGAQQSIAREDSRAPAGRLALTQAPRPFTPDTTALTRNWKKGPILAPKLLKAGRRRQTLLSTFFRARTSCAPESAPRCGFSRSGHKRQEPPCRAALEDRVEEVRQRQAPPSAAPERQQG